MKFISCKIATVKVVIKAVAGDFQSESVNRDNEFDFLFVFKND
jgi:hypothetical protein